MDYEKYYQAFKSLNISVDPLPQNYTPEDFGRRLMSLSQTEQDVSYSASTEYVKSPLKNLTIPFPHQAPYTTIPKP